MSGDARLLDDVIFVESRVLRGRVKKKHVSLERGVVGSDCSDGGAGGSTEKTFPVLRVGKALCYPLDPRAVLVEAGQGCSRFEEVMPGRFFNGASRGSRKSTTERLELFQLDLSTSDDSWGRGVLRLCFESRSALDRGTRCSWGKFIRIKETRFTSRCSGRRSTTKWRLAGRSGNPSCTSTG